jgi:tetratricopeptide (TPR) repeat protein
LYFYQCRLCLEESRAQDALEAIESAHQHILQAADKDTGILNTPLYIRVLSNLGIVNLAMGRYSQSENFHKLAIGRCAELGTQEQCSMGNLTQNLGSCYLWSGDLEKAEETLRLALSQTNKNRESAQYTLGNIMLRLKRYNEALTLHREVLQTYLTDPDPSILRQQILGTR